MSRLFDEELLFNNNPPLINAPVSMSCLLYPITNTDANSLVFVGEDGGDQWYVMQLKDRKSAAYSRNAGCFPIAETAQIVGVDSWFQFGAVFAHATLRSAYFEGGNKATNIVNCAPDGAQFDKVKISGVNTKGNMAEVGIWNVALTDEEMEILGKFVSPLLVRPESLVFYLPLIRDDDNDLIGGLHLTEVGTPQIATHPNILHYSNA